jgi:hypothetical protein
MPLRNRVQPDGTIVAAMQRGTLFGNRGGPFHDEAQMSCSSRDGDAS